MKVNLNGELVEQSEAKVSVFDHGLLYGDGVFEGIRSYDGKVFRLEQHLERLYNSAHSIALDILLSMEEYEEEILRTLRANQLRDAYIRAVVTRGVGDLGLSPFKCPKSSYFIITDKIELYPEEFYRNGLETITSSVRRNIPEAVDPQIKSLNYLNNILAHLEACGAGVLEAIMLNSDGYVVEGSADNIFIVQNGVLKTPPTYLGALPGITRGAILELSEKIGIKKEVTPFTKHDVYIAEECFFTGTGAEVVPVVKVDGRLVGSGKPGKITDKLREAFIELTKQEGTSIYPAEKSAAS